MSAVPDDVAVHAEGLELGKLYGIYPVPNVALSWFLRFAGTAIVIILAAGAFGTARNSRWALAVALGAGAVAMVLLVPQGMAAIRRALTRRGIKACYLYEGGLVGTSLWGGVRWSAAWHETTGLSWTSTRIVNWGLTAHHLRLTRRDLSPIVMNFLGETPPLARDLMKLRAKATSPG
jgi:hypothetical protein